MPRRLCWLLVTAALLIGGTVAKAGPWPRDDGAVFLSLSQERDADSNAYTSVYGEYGLGPRQTLGVEAGRNTFGDASFLIWLQQAFGSGAVRYATSLGMGLAREEDENMPVGQIGLSWGRGFGTRWGDAWVASETKFSLAARRTTETVRLSPTTQMLYEYLVPDTGVKSELTLGLKPWDGTMLIGQVRMQQTVDRDFAASLATSVVRDVGKRMKIELGVIGPLTGDSEPGLKIGTWIAF